jgi:hypothetical protein
LGDAYIPADAVETAALRAGSLARILGETLAATHLTAAWIHGALHAPPARHTVQRAVSKRLHVVPDRHLVYRDLTVPADEVQRIGGVLVTTPARTLVDLSRGDEEHRRAATQLAAIEPRLLRPAIARLEAGRLPGKRAALTLLRQLAVARQDDVTR